ncbi:hypothetical protein P9112_012968 [Eukaryota sp. TZLM1-RC]
MFRCVTPFVDTVKTRNLDIDDLPNCYESDSVESIKVTFIPKWYEELDCRSSPSLIRCIWNTYKSTLVFLSLATIFSSLLSFVHPTILRLILNELESAGPTNYVVLLLSFLVVFLLFQEILSNFISVKVTSFSCRLRSSLAVLVCQSSLYLSSESKTKLGSGKTINTVSSDCMILSRAVRDAYTLVALPIRISISFVYLYRLAGGTPALLSLFLFLITFPISTVLTRSLIRSKKKTREASDDRVKFLNESISGIKTIKLGGLESFIKRKISKYRDLELGFLKKVKILRAVWTLVFQSVPVFLVLAMIVSITVFNPENLTVSTVMTSLTLISMLSRPLQMLPMKVAKFLEAKVSLDRINSVLHSTKVNDIPLHNSTFLSIPPNAQFKWGSGSGDFTLDMNGFGVEIKERELIIVQGVIASGKSTLLSSVFGDPVQVQGLPLTRGSALYVSETPWIRSATIRDNIILFNQFDPNVYSIVIHACSLSSILQFKDQDLTIIGNKGHNLSGGENFASLDHDTQLHITKHLFPLLLQRSAVIVATHHPQLFSHYSHRVLTLSHGKVVHDESHCGSVCVDQVEFKPYTTSFLKKQAIQAANEITVFETINWRIHLLLLRALGGTRFIISVILLLCLSQFFLVFSDFVLSNFLSNSTTSTTLFLTLFGGSRLLTVFFSAFTTLFVSFAVLSAAKVLHSNLIDGIFGTTLDFFDETPLGRITNRISQDISNLDSRVQMEFLKVLKVYSSVFSHLVAVIAVVPVLFIPVALVSFLYFKLQQRFRLLYSQVKRLVSSSKSPIFHVLQEILTGSSTIRSLGVGDQFVSADSFNNATKSQFFQVLVSSWLSIRLTLIGLVLIAFVGFCSLIFDLSPAFFGLLLMYAINVQTSIKSMIESYLSFEGTLTSVERIDEYANLNQEVDVFLPNQPTPRKPCIEFESVSARYKKHLPLVLDGVSFTTEAFSKTAIIGETGSGKSSLFNVLLRTLKLEEGDVLIDGISIEDLPLSFLRCYIAICPQDPVLFSSTLRFNLDPTESFSDTVLFDTMTRTGLNTIEFYDGTTLSLDSYIPEAGATLSVGTRQLISVCRTLMSNAKIVLIDEASSSLDQQSDKVLTKCLSELSKKSSVITIAHRLQTIVDYDQILVVNDGHVTECTDTNRLFLSCQ